MTKFTKYIISIKLKWIYTYIIKQMRERKNYQWLLIINYARTGIN